MTALQRVSRWPSPWRQLALLVLLVLAGLDWLGMRLVRLWAGSTPPFRLAMAVMALVLLILLAGCAGMRPTFELHQKPAHTCTGFAQCFGQIWIGFITPL